MNLGRWLGKKLRSVGLPGAAVPLLVIATALDRYRFDIASLGFRIEHIAFVIVGSVWLVYALGERRFPKPSFDDSLLVLYLGVGLIASLMHAPDLKESLKFLGLMSFGVALYWLVQVTVVDVPIFKRSVKTLAVIGLLEALVGIGTSLLHLFGINLGMKEYSFGTYNTFSPLGTLYDSNTFGIYLMAIALLLMTWLFLGGLDLSRRTLGMAIGLTLVAIALSLTRAAWIGLLVGLFFILLLSKERRLGVAIGIGALAIIGAVLAIDIAFANPGHNEQAGGGTTGLITRLGSLSITRLLASGSVDLRVDTYSRAFNDWLREPFIGNGVNVFAQKYISPSGDRGWVSNMGLMALHDTGIIGLVILLSWLVWIGRDTIQALRQAESSFMRTTLLALGVSFVGLLVADQATTTFWLGFSWIYLGLIRAGTHILQAQSLQRLGAPRFLRTPAPATELP